MKKYFILFLTVNLFFANINLFAATWNVDADGNWNTAGNWNPVAVPNSGGTDVNFENVITAPRTITVDANITTGALTFDSANAYLLIPSGGLPPGNLSVEGSTITISNINGDGAHTIANEVSINAALGVTINQGSTGVFTISGNVLGSKSLTKSGTGALTLSGNNSYSGGTIIDAGTINISGTSSMGSGTVTLNTSGILASSGSFAIANAITPAGGVISVTNTLTLSGFISGNGILKKEGTGSLLVSNGSNDYSGGTSVNQGTLSVATSAALGTGQLDLAGGTTLQLAGGGGVLLTNDVNVQGLVIIDVPSGIFNLSGPVGGTGSITKTGVGAFSMTNGSNNYSGGTFLNAGSLDISGASNLGSGSLVLNGGVLLIQDVSGSVNFANPITLAGGFIETISSHTLSGPLTGSGALIKFGIGSIEISNASNNYSGGTNISAGTLVGTTSSLQGNIVNSGTLNFNQSISGTYSGALSGAGALQKNGTGTATFSGNSSSFSGTTSIVQGRLNVNVAGQLGGDVSVALGATLGGAGQFGGNVTNNGTTAPGDSIGTMTVLGNYVQGSAAFLEVELNPSISDLLDITGTANIDGTVTIIPENGSYASGTQYTILNAAGGLSGTFSTITSQNPALQFSDSYTANSVILTLAADAFVLTLPNGATPNEAAVFDYLIGLCPGASSDLCGIVDDLANLNSSDLLSALNQMQPSNLGAFYVSAASLNSLISSMTNRLSYKCCEMDCNLNQPELWAEPFAFSLYQGAREDQVGFNASTTGFSTGFADCFGHFKLGVAAGFDYTHLKWEESRGSSNVWSYFGRAFTGYCANNYFIDFSFLGSQNFVGIKRNISFPGVSRVAKSDHSSFTLSPRLAMGYSIIHGRKVFEPYNEFDYVYLYAPEFTENGAQSLDLSINSRSSNVIRNELGLRMKAEMHYKETCFTPIIWAGLVLQKPFGSSFVSALDNQVSTFTVQSYKQLQSRATAGFDLRFLSGGRYHGSVKYTLEVGSKFLLNAGEFFFGYEF